MGTIAGPVNDFETLLGCHPLVKVPGTGFRSCRQLLRNSVPGTFTFTKLATRFGPTAHKLQCPE